MAFENPDLSMVPDSVKNGELGDFGMCMNLLYWASQDDPETSFQALIMMVLGLMGVSWDANDELLSLRELDLSLYDQREALIAEGASSAAIRALRLERARTSSLRGNQLFLECLKTLRVIVEGDHFDEEGMLQAIVGSKSEYIQTIDVHITLLNARILDLQIHILTLLGEEIQTPDAPVMEFEDPVEPDVEQASSPNYTAPPP